MGTDILHISHLMSIAALVPEGGADQEVAIASLLHDAAEDQGSEDVPPVPGGAAAAAASPGGERRNLSHRRCGRQARFTATSHVRRSSGRPVTTGLTSLVRRGGATLIQGRGQAATMGYGRTGDPPPGWIWKWTCGGVPRASPLSPLKPMTVPRRTNAPSRAAAAYESRWA